MKTLLSLLLCAALGLSAAFAQKIGLSLHVGALNTDNIQPNRDALNLNYTSSSSMGLVLRKFTDKKFAIRVGGAYNDVVYSLTNTTGADTVSYNASRRDVKLVIGLEKHFFVLDKHLDLYGGAQIPFVWVGKDEIVQSTYQSITNGTTGAGLGVMAGANYRLLKIRFGLEYGWSYSAFKTNVWDNASSMSLTTLRRSAQEVAFTVGIYL